MESPSGHATFQGDHSPRSVINMCPLEWYVSSAQGGNGQSDGGKFGKKGYNSNTRMTCSGGNYDRIRLRSTEI